MRVREIISTRAPTQRGKNTYMDETLICSKGSAPSFCSCSARHSTRAGIVSEEEEKETSSAGKNEATTEPTCSAADGGGGGGVMLVVVVVVAAGEGRRRLWFGVLGEVLVGD